MTDVGVTGFFLPAGISEVHAPASFWPPAGGISLLFLASQSKTGLGSNRN